MTEAPPYTPTPVRRAVWPTVLGIIMVILGAAALFGYGCCISGFCAALPLVIEWLEPLAKSDPNFRGQIAQYQVMADWRFALVASNLLAGALGALLLTAGVKLYRRNASSRSLTLTWCWGKLVFLFPATALGGWVNYLGAKAYATAMEDTPVIPAGIVEIVASFGIIGTVMTVLWQAALPVFLLIWLTRSGVRDEIGEWQ